MEIVLGALVPCAVLLVVIHRTFPPASDGRGSAWFFVILTLIWFAPCWFTNSTPVSLDYLTQFAPWSDLRPDGYLDRNPLLNDIPLQMLPWREAVREAIVHGSLPLLGRFAGSGTPLWENLQTAVLYPVNIAALVFSTFAWPLFASVSKVLIALWGTWLLLRNMGLGTNASRFGAIAYGFGSFTITFLMFPHTNVTTLLPLFLFTLDRIARTRSRRMTAASAVLLFAMMAGGHPESLLHCALVAIPFAIVLIVRADRMVRARLGLGFLTLGVIALLLAAPLLLPFAAYLDHSQRVYDIANEPGFLSTSPFEIETFIPFAIPNYFGNPRVHNYRHGWNYNELTSQYTGLVTLLFAIVTLLSTRGRPRFWTMALLMTLPLAIEPIWLYQLIKPIPILGHTANSRLRFVLSLAIAILAAHGYERFERSENARVIRVIFGLGFVGVSAFCLVSYPLFATYGIRRLIFFTEIAALAGTVLVSVSVEAWNPLLKRVVPLLLFADLFSVTGLYNPALGKSLDYPMTPALALIHTETPSRILGLGRTLQPNTASMPGVEDIRSHDPIAFRPYVALLDRAGYDRTTYFGRFLQPPPRVLLDYLGVRYLMTSHDTEGWTETEDSTNALIPSARERPDLEDLVLVHTGSDAKLYENPKALARFFIPSDIRHSPDPVADFLVSTDARVVHTNSSSMQTPKGTLLLERYESNGAAVNVQTTNEPTFVATSEVALPGWELRRDGQSWPMETVNGVFLGWRVPKEGGHFELAYRPIHLRLGFGLALLGLAMAAVLIVIPTKIQPVVSHPS